VKNLFFWLASSAVPDFNFTARVIVRRRRGLCGHRARCGPWLRILLRYWNARRRSLRVPAIPT